MDWVSPTAIEAMAVVVSDTGPPSPMFSPAEVQLTPAEVSRSPIGGSPGHWWERPQPSAISRLCADEVVSKPAVRVSAGSPAEARAWLISASTCAAGAPSWSAVGLAVGEAVREGATDGAELGPDELAGADELADADADAEAEAEAEADADGRAFVRCGPAAVRLGGTIATAGAAATAIAAGLLAQGPAPAAPQPAAVVRGLVTLPADDGPR